MFYNLFVKISKRGSVLTDARSKGITEAGIQYILFTATGTARDFKSF